MDGPDSRQTWGAYDEHAPALERFAVLLTGDRAYAAAVVAQAVRRARDDPAVSDADPRSTRACLFNAVRTIIVDEQRGAGLRIDPQTVWPDDAPAGDINAAADRLLLRDALAQLGSETRAAIRSAYYRGWTTGQVAARQHLSDGAVKSTLHDGLRSLLVHLRTVGVAPSC